MKILVVEDDPINQKLLVKILENKGISTLTANDGLEAISLLSDLEILDQIILIFMDCQMPNLDGFETTIAIRNSENVFLKKVPIYAVSAHLDELNQQKCIEVGMNGYIAKPYKVNQITEILLQII